jgi:hypothetical protein
MPSGDVYVADAVKSPTYGAPSLHRSVRVCSQIAARSAVALLLLLTPVAAQAPPPLARPLPVVNLPVLKVECLTAQRPDGTWTEPRCGGRTWVPMPEGEFRQIVHTHTNLASLSLADLRLLARLEQVTAVTAEARYVARRRPRFDDLDELYPVLWERMMRREYGINRKTLHAINLQLAVRGVIAYRVESRPAN